MKDKTVSELAPKELRNIYENEFLNQFSKGVFKDFDKIFIKYFKTTTLVKFFIPYMETFLDVIEFDRKQELSLRILSVLLNYIFQDIKNEIIEPKDLNAGIYGIDKIRLQLLKSEIDERKAEKKIAVYVKDLNEFLFNKKFEYGIEEIYYIEYVLEVVFNKYEFFSDALYEKYEDALEKINEQEVIVSGFKQNVKRNYLSRDEEISKIYHTLIQRILHNGVTKYRAIKEYCENNNITDLKNEQKKLESYLKYHKTDIIEEYKLDHKQFNKHFFPNSRSQD